MAEPQMTIQTYMVVITTLLMEATMMEISSPTIAHAMEATMKDYMILTMTDTPVNTPPWK